MVNTTRDRKYSKECAMCGIGFVTNIYNKNICSFPCKIEHNRQHSRYYARLKRANMKCDPCIICGFSETTDRHREGKDFYTLCPNHHCLITRGIKTIEELLSLDK